MNIQRFEFASIDDWGNDIGSCERLEIDGDYVRYCDHVSELAELQATVARQAALLREVTESVTGRNGTFARIPADWFDRRDAGISASVAAPEIERLKGGQGDVQMAAVPVERCYDVRAKMIIAVNEARKNGGDLDDGLDAAYKSALRYSPSSLPASQPAPVSVVVDEMQAFANLLHEVIEFTHRADGVSKVQRKDIMSLHEEKISYEAWSARACLDKVKELNQ